MSAGASPIGLDVGRRVLKAAQRMGDGRVLTALVTRSELGLLEDLDRMGSTLWRRGFRGRTVIASAPERSALMASIELPRPETGAPVRTIASAELARLHGREPGGLESTVIYRDLAPNARSGRGAQAFAFAVDSAEVIADVAALEGQGGRALRVARVECGPLALARALGASMGPGASCAIEHGWTRLTVTVCEGGVPIFVRTLDDLGLSQLDQQRQSSPGSLSTFYQRMSEELERSLAYGVRECGSHEPVPTLIACPARAYGPMMEVGGTLVSRGVPVLLRASLAFGAHECSGRFARAIGLAISQVTAGVGRFSTAQEPEQMDKVAA